MGCAVVLVRVAVPLTASSPMLSREQGVSVAVGVRGVFVMTVIVIELLCLMERWRVLAGLEAAACCGVVMKTRVLLLSEVVRDWLGRLIEGLFLAC